jgi:acetoacetyl-CoA synthetase
VQLQQKPFLYQDLPIVEKLFSKGYSMSSSAPVLWQPSPEKILGSNLTHFRQWLHDKKGIILADDQALYDWSVEHIDFFWSTLWDFLGIIGEKGERILIDADKMPGARFFPDAKLNYAENLLHGLNDKNEIIFHGEDKISRRFAVGDTRVAVSRIQQALQRDGVTVGDRVAALLPNMPEAIFAVLGATSLGAVWSSASPDFGVQGIIDRFGQIAPHVLFIVDGYYYNGKWVDCTDKIEAIKPLLPDTKQIVVVPYDGQTVRLSQAIDGVVDYNDWLKGIEPNEISFTRVSFDHPLFILFSSGTTGVPKCIVHGTGGPLLQLMKEHQLHCDIRPGDRVFYFTTCSWMMWNWLVTAMASQASLMLYDGSPFHPDGNILFDYADQEKFTLFGTSAKFIDTLHKQNYRPKDTHSLKTMRAMTSTGSPLVDESFAYVYDAIKNDIHLSSISGGTDIVSCFMLGYPTWPVHSGQLQGAGLGLAVDVYRADGTKADTGEKGELVCLKPFPCMPVAFWNDADGAKYRKAYFERFPGLWHHGDYVEKTAEGGFIIHGRSDATLNPGGVRIGTAEIYRQVEQLPEITESIAVGQKWGDDERIVLAVILKAGVVLDTALEQKIRQQIKTGTTSRHVPGKIIAVTDIPRTKSGKISEIAVRDTINGQVVANTEALANPQALAQYQMRPELQD